MSAKGLGIIERGGSPQAEQTKKSPLRREVSDSDSDEVDPLQKLGDIELLPDLFALLQSLEKGDVQPKDFNNNAGTMRLKVNNVRQYLQEVDGICETVNEREKKIKTIEESNEKKVEFLSQFRERVLTDLGKLG
ncbi:CIC11C00000005288 [Sungouiella intermedia]|uniref:Mediator of RNA polymerase II transcription subunit 9 n=1 Tax=Sungouiella intermedia TaxID=45354 RepID=A0A1L0BGP7_9ASCO|nr:CIC11C00000005288 [[Candida] intermedia]